MRIALVHDYLNEFGGAERVLLALSEMYPQAPIYTIYFRKSSTCGEKFNNKKIIQSWFSNLPFAEKLISPLRFLLPAIWRSFDFSNYDLVITSSAWAITRGMPNAKREVCYLHTPPRYLYGYDDSRNWKNLWFAGLVKIYALVINHFMRMYDFNAAQKPSFYITNSENVAKRLKKFYRRDDYKVVYPPVDIEKFGEPKIKPGKGDYYLTGGRLIAHKNFDLIIKAFNKNRLKLKIFGTGLMEEELKNMAKQNIEFLGMVSEANLISLYKRAKAFIVASKDEDFGITPIEAAAAGTPTIAYKGEGYLESVIENETGVFFDELTGDSLAKAVKKSEDIKWDKNFIKKHARKFSKERFEKEVRSIIKKYA